MITDFPNGKKLIIGCIHLLPMPNTPFYTSGDFERSLEKAVKDAAALKTAVRMAASSSPSTVFTPTLTTPTTSASPAWRLWDRRSAA